ncbi:M23 family metallopeptidase [Martelella mediterranea]|uniref:Murein DD-endopeptidase MepM/ murein hydrolase activator NlpD n=1 Tax=Martelella mediterranea TaxID=293089 RepID=A0A4R3NHW0_9HYPH|nr:M23 family metallopeptidase [Martelella mediterranea]TCT33080.1 murein DD-endopeptidase MepM/ murein hydrolase activator NlpD [Martelella mediterranea]
MKNKKNPARSFGRKTPIVVDGRRPPARRDVSLRWLTGACLTGLTGTALMAVALSAAVDGRQRLAIPASAFASATPGISATDDDAVRGKRLIPTTVIAKPSNKRILQVPTVERQDNRDVIHYEAFSEVKMALAANYGATPDYPAFDPFAVFSTGETPDGATGSNDMIYGTDVVGEVELQTDEFSLNGNTRPYAGELTTQQIEAAIRSNEAAFQNSMGEVSMLSYVNPDRFEADTAVGPFNPGLTAQIVDENVSVSALQSVFTQDFNDDILPVRQPVEAAALLKAAGYPGRQADEMSRLIDQASGSDMLEAGDVIRIGLMRMGRNVRVVRISLYRAGDHVMTMALNDEGRFVKGVEPALSEAVANASAEDTDLLIGMTKKPVRVYDGIYRAALSYGLNERMAAQLVSLLASKVNLQAQASPDDQLDLFFSNADENGQATETSELFYIDAQIGDQSFRLYRYRDPKTGAISFYDREGKSIRRFLLRNPVPNGKFTSGFGMRRHPVLKYARMHSGVDWAAPTGTPIIAAGDGVVEKAGWSSSGYGNQTIIRHANGYETSYNHQSKIAPGVTEGARVKQGQVIGYIGATGLVTGPHLHYEMIVNGTKVDPMKIKFPNADALSGENLVQFESERKRIDALLGNSTETNIASNAANRS